MKTAALAALNQAKETIKTWHGDAGWEIYEKHSPEMKQINKAIQDLQKSDDEYYFIKITSDHWMEKNKAQAAAKEIANDYDRRYVAAKDIPRLQDEIIRSIRRINDEHKRCKDLEYTIYYPPLQKHKDEFTVQVSGVFILQAWKARPGYY